MPHIEISCYPGRTEEQKQLFAQKVVEDMVEIMGCKASSISVAIKDVPAESWKAEVWDKKIVPDKENLYKKPEYSCNGESLL